MPRVLLRATLPGLLLALACGGNPDDPATPTVPPLSLALDACPAIPAASAGPARPLAESFAAAPDWYSGADTILFSSSKSKEGMALPMIEAFDEVFAQASPAAPAGDRAILCAVTPKKPISSIRVTAPGLPRAEVYYAEQDQLRFSAPLSPGKPGKIRVEAWWNAGSCEPGLDPVWLLLTGLPIPNCYSDMREVGQADLGAGPIATEAFDAECRYLDAAAVSAQLVPRQQAFAEAFTKACAGEDHGDLRDAADGLAALAGWTDPRVKAALSAMATLEQERAKTMTARVQAIAAAAPAAGGWVDLWPGVLRVQVEPRTCGKKWAGDATPDPGDTYCGSILRVQNISGAPLETATHAVSLQGRSHGWSAFGLLTGAEIVTTAGERIDAGIALGSGEIEPAPFAAGETLEGFVNWPRAKGQQEAWIELRGRGEAILRLRL